MGFSRKFLLCVCLLVASTVLVVAGFAEFSAWASFVQWIFGLYAGSNVGTKLSQVIQKPDQRTKPPHNEEEAGALINV